MPPHRQNSPDLLPLDDTTQPEESHQILPVTRILDFSNDHHQRQFLKAKLEFCCHAVLKAIDSFLSGTYSDFDGHTTSNCCHGMAVLTRSVIHAVLPMDLRQVQEEGREKLRELEGSQEKELLCNWWIPEPLLNLTCLYILGMIREVDPVKGGRTVTKRLKQIGPIGVNVCTAIVNALQAQFANLVANRYADYLDEMSDTMQINGAPVHLWGKYVKRDHIRTDHRGVQYASNLFSMEVSLAYLSYTKAKVALINDILHSTGELKGRYVALFEGDGTGGFRPLSHQETKILGLSEPEEPVVIFGGCAYCDHLDKDSFSLQVQPWLSKLTNLILACDIFYPQFFRVIDDPNFDSSPITPDEEQLREVINQHSTVRGIAAEAPTFYCLTHIYPASVGQVLKVWHETADRTLPVSFIPGDKSIGVCAVADSENVIF